MVARDLESAWSEMSWAVESGEFALVGFAEPPEAADLALLGEAPSQLIREADETSVLVRMAAVPGLVQRHPTAQVEGPLLWIRFDAPMGWEVVGFLARVTTALAAAEVPIGAVCGFSRDHLFVSVRYRKVVVRVLGELFPRVTGE